MSTLTDGRRRPSRRSAESSGRPLVNERESWAGIKQAFSADSRYESKPELTSFHEILSLQTLENKQEREPVWPADGRRSEIDGDFGLGDRLVGEGRNSLAERRADAKHCNGRHSRENHEGGEQAEEVEEQRDETIASHSLAAELRTLHVALERVLPAVRKTIVLRSVLKTVGFSRERQA